MRLSLPPQYSRLLLGVVLGFILGTVLYQSQRREWNVRGDVGPTNSCIENKVSNSCPSGGVNMGTYCYLPEGAPCDAFGEQGTCGAGACIPNQFACCVNNMCSLQTAETCVSPSFFHTGMNCAQAQQNPLNNCGLPPCSAGMVTCSPFVPQATSPVCCATGNACNDSDDDGFYDSCLGSSNSSNQCAALGTACGTQVDIPCTDNTACSAASDDYCASGLCHYKKILSCCAGSTCDSNSGTCVATPNYCCNTSNYTCYPSSSSSSSSSCITVGNGGCTTPADCCSTSARPLFCDFGANSSSSTGYCNDRPSSSSSSSSCKGGGVTCAEDGECCSDYCNSTNNFTCDYTSPAPCESGQTSRQNANGSILCCTPPFAPVDTDGDGNYECAGSPPTTPPPATTNPTGTNPTAADPTTVCPAGQCCPACGADFTCITLVAGAPQCIPNDYLSTSSSLSSSSRCQGAVYCGLLPGSGAEKCCYGSQACFWPSGDPNGTCIDTSSASSCASVGTSCVPFLNNCCNGCNLQSLQCT